MWSVCHQNNDGMIGKRNLFLFTSKCQKRGKCRDKAAKACFNVEDGEFAKELNRQT